MDASKPFDGYKQIEYREISSLPLCLEWLQRDVLGAGGAAWAEHHWHAHHLKRKDMLLRDLRHVWPQLVRFDDVPRFGLSNDFVSPSFLQSIGRDKVVEFAYPVVLDQPADEEGTMFYRSKLEDGYSQNKLINDFLSSKEAAARMTRTVLDGRKLSELRRTAAHMSSFVYFKSRKKEAQNFFARPNLNNASNETGIDWHLLYKDESAGKRILSPGMNLVGTIQPNGLFEAGDDWVLYGPKIRIPAGNYSVHLGVVAERDFHFYIDAAGNGGVTHFFQADLSGSCDVTINFNVPTKVDDFEFRILNKTGRRQTIDLKVVNLKRA